MTVTRADGTVTASWPAVGNATKYHVTYSSDNKQSWTAASDSHTANSIAIGNADNAKSYIVAVRAGNDAGWSGWRNSTAAGPYLPGIVVQDSGGNAIATLSIPEGGEASYQVKLATQPEQNVKVRVGLSVRDNNDADITFKGQPSDTAAIEMTFTPTNWNTAQTVTLLAAEDADAVNGVRDTIHDARTFENYDYFLGNVGLAATEADNDPPPAPTNLSVTPGDGYLDIAWDAVSGATGYDVRAKAAGSSDWTDVASNITATSYRYTTTATIDYVAVRGRNANGAGDWTELSRAPDENWLNTVQQFGGASLQMAESQAQSQLDAPASITVTRENSSRDEKLYVSWAVVTGAEGYNLACAASPNNSPYASWSWWHCGSVNSGSTTTFTVDQDGRSGENNDRNTQDLGWDRAYMVAVRAVTDDPDDASPWLLSTNAHPAMQPVNITVSRAAGSVSVSWDLSVAGTKHTRGYEIECATRENNVTGAYTRCADVESATFTNRAITGTISSWTAGGTNYTIDDTKIYDLRLRHTNAWGESHWNLAPLIYPLTLTTSNVKGTSVTLTVANHTGNWYYKYTSPNGGTCSSAQTGATAEVTGLDAGTTYTFKAYSDSTCSTLLTTAANFTTLTTFTTGTHYITTTGATLILSGHSGGWYYQADTGPDTTCRGPWQSTYEATVMGLTPGTWYTYKAYTDGGCFAAHLLATVRFNTSVLSVTNLNFTDNTAKLNLAGHTGAWWYTNDQAGNVCTSVAAGTPADLTNITAGGQWVFKAYSDSTCTTEIASLGYAIL